MKHEDTRWDPSREVAAFVAQLSDQLIGQGSHRIPQSAAAPNKVAAEGAAATLNLASSKVAADDDGNMSGSHHDASLSSNCRGFITKPLTTPLQLPLIVSALKQQSYEQAIADHGIVGYDSGSLMWTTDTSAVSAAVGGRQHHTSSHDLQVAQQV